jgi:hypothetical protein
MSSLPILAGVISTAVFAGSMLPMLVKAVATRDLGSYSLGNLALANVGNGVHTLYVIHLPLGPIWLLHGFHSVTALLMLVWYLRYGRAASSRPGGAARPAVVTPR